MDIMYVCNVCDGDGDGSTFYGTNQLVVDCRAIFLWSDDLHNKTFHI